MGSASATNEGSTTRASILSSGNILAGVSVGAYFIPQAMAYGGLAGIDPAAGLTVAVVPLIVYMILGRSTAMSVGPESAVALMAAAAVGPVAAAQGVPSLTALAVTSILVGLILGAAWLLRASFLADLLSHPILVGYLTGVAVLMVVSQLPNVFDIELDTSSIPALFQSDWSEPNYLTVVIAVVVLAVSLISRAINPRIPGPLIGLLLSIVMAMNSEIPKVGPVTLSLPQPQLEGFSLALVGALIGPAVSIALVSFTDVMVTSRAFSVGVPPEPALEMRALAAVQGVTGIAGGYPMSASSSRTALAVAAGATSRFYSIFVIAILIGGPLLFPGVVAAIPMAGLAGVILYAAWTLIDPAEWVSMRRFRRREVVIAATCALSVVVFGILPGVIIAVCLSIAEFMARLARPHEGVLGFVPGMEGMHDVDDWETSTTIPGLVVFRYDAPLFFMNAYDFNAKVKHYAPPGTEVVILNMEANVELDFTALNALADLYEALADQDTELWLARVKQDVLTPMRKHGVADAIREEHVFATLPVAVQAYRDRSPSASE